MRRFPSGAARRAATAATVAAGSIVSASLWFGLGLVSMPAPPTEPQLELEPLQALELRSLRQVPAAPIPRSSLSLRGAR